MPKNSKVLMSRTQWREYECPCGYKYVSNDDKGNKMIMKLHRRVCEVAKQCITLEKTIKRTTDIECGTIHQQTVKIIQSKKNKNANSQN